MVVYLVYAGFRSAKLSKLELESIYLLFIFYPFFVCLFQTQVYSSFLKVPTLQMQCKVMS